MMAQLGSEATHEEPGKPAVELRDVWFGYGSEPVIAGATFSVGEREAVCVVGPNGGGKTTLFKLILGLQRPDSGEVRVFGLTPERARRRIGYVPQSVSFDPQFPVTALEVVLMGRLAGRPAGPYSKTDRGVALGALADIGLAELADHPFSELSMGQRQRVLIARALSTKPDLLLLDEPTANIDAAVEEKIYALLDKLRERMTIMMISHDLAFVASIFKRVVCVHRTVAVHPTEDVTDDKLRRIYGADFRMVRHDVGGHEAGGRR
jgi:zinc transport system ATP-binding protein